MGTICFETANHYSQLTSLVLADVIPYVTQFSRVIFMPVVDYQFSSYS